MLFNYIWTINCWYSEFHFQFFNSHLLKSLNLMSYSFQFYLLSFRNVYFFLKEVKLSVSSCENDETGSSVKRLQKQSQTRDIDQKIWVAVSRNLKRIIDGWIWWDKPNLKWKWLVEQTHLKLTEMSSIWLLVSHWVFVYQSYWLL